MSTRSVKHDSSKPVTLCAGCKWVINETEYPTDEHERPWHAKCLTDSERPNQSDGWDVLLWLACWPWALTRLIGRRRDWRPVRANVAGIVAAVLLLVAVLAVKHEVAASSAIPDASALAASVGTNVVDHWRTDLPLGTTIRATSTVCGDVEQGSARCAIRVAVASGKTHQTGSIFVTVSDFHRDGTYRWLQTGTAGSAFE